jgi:hypothetical protein
VSGVNHAVAARRATAPAGVGGGPGLWLMEAEGGGGDGMWRRLDLGRVCRAHVSWPVGHGSSENTDIFGGPSSFDGPMEKTAESSLIFNSPKKPSKIFVFLAATLKTAVTIRVHRKMI